MEAVRSIKDDQNIVTVTLDVPGKPVNTCTPQLLRELAAALEMIERERPAGIIFASAKAKSFNAGADFNASGRPGLTTVPPKAVCDPTTAGAAATVSSPVPSSFATRRITIGCKGTARKQIAMTVGTTMKNNPSVLMTAPAAKTV